MNNSVEFEKLVQYLTDHNYRIQVYRGECSGCQVIVYDENDHQLWDAVCNNMSYGHEAGLLEIAGILVKTPFDEVEGHLTADDIIKRLEEQQYA